MDIENIKGQINMMLDKLPAPVKAKLDEFEKTTSQDKALIAGGAFVFAVLLFLFLCPQPLVLNIVGCAYPIYASMKMLAEESMSEAPMWITYWVVFTSFKMIMGPLDLILSFVPFYFYFKLTFLIYLFYPSTKGAQKVLDMIIKVYVFPLLKPDKSD
ncbi:hypothetical protein CTAYLR_010629 [Chrysophaeum taylorii]|uniref:Receptor expression-enhancing protein n=1 Tax=Chrysophaeum taylorii TaxID=2483200 RepID=A0AAD7UF96_9STRA|nr:hypothetical protein CTAYLR_010629 [Chrysophaeum taylorii]